MIWESHLYWTHQAVLYTIYRVSMSCAQGSLWSIMLFSALFRFPPCVWALTSMLSSWSTCLRKSGKDRLIHLQQFINRQDSDALVGSFFVHILFLLPGTNLYSLLFMFCSHRSRSLAYNPNVLLIDIRYVCCICWIMFRGGRAFLILFCCAGYSHLSSPSMHTSSFLKVGKCGLEVCRGNFQSMNNSSWYESTLWCNIRTGFTLFWFERALPIAWADVKRDKVLASDEDTRFCFIYWHWSLFSFCCINHCLVILIWSVFRFSILFLSVKVLPVMTLADKLW